MLVKTMGIKMAFNWSDESPGTSLAGSAAWVEGAGMENSNSALPAQKEGTGRQEVSCGKTFSEHSNVVPVCLCQI